MKTSITRHLVCVYRGSAQIKTIQRSLKVNRQFAQAIYQGKWYVATANADGSYFIQIPSQCDRS